MESEIPSEKCRNSFQWVWPLAQQHCRRAKRFRKRNKVLRTELWTLRRAYRKLRMKYEELRLKNEQMRERVVKAVSEDNIMLTLAPIEEPPVGVEEAALESDNSYNTEDSVRSSPRNNDEQDTD